MVPSRTIPGSQRNRSSRSCFRSPLLAALFFAAFFSVLPPACAQAPEISALAARLARTLEEGKIELLAVPDCIETLGKETALDQMLADDLAKGFASSGPRIHVLSRQALWGILEKSAFNGAYLEDADGRGWFGDLTHADAVAVSHVQIAEGKVHLNVEIYSRKKHWKKVGEDSAEFAMTPEHATAAALEVVPPRVKVRIYDPGGNGIRNLGCVPCLEPPYPPEARQNGIQGVVSLRILIDQEGRVRRVYVDKGAPAGLTESAVQTVYSWKWKPAWDENGQPVPVWMSLNIKFSLP